MEISRLTTELQDALTLDEKPKPSSNGRMGPPLRSNTFEKGAAGSVRAENVPPRTGSTSRPSKSQEEAMRARKAAGSSSRRAPNGDLNIFADPSDSPRKSVASSRPRRNSDSSTIKMSETDEERRRRRREREKRHRERDAKDPKIRKPKNLDIIDKLDVTSIYGTGRKLVYFDRNNLQLTLFLVFHHDGPFDACNPHRNRQGSRRAPMQAFPKDSLNNVMGGGGPLNKRPDHSTFLGNNDEEAFKDYSAEAYGNGAIRPDGPARQASNILNPLAPEPIHGDESLGLGTSTFLEGTPASREAIARRQQESTATGMDSGLQRKKSLAQKIRGIRNERPNYGPSGRITSPEGVTSPGSPYTPGGSRRSETNPFNNEFSSNVDKKQDNITIVEPERISGHNRAPSSPKRFGEGLQRRATSDGSDAGAGEPSKFGAGGFLSRVKSLKGGPRKPREQKPLI